MAVEMVAVVVEVEAEAASKVMLRFERLNFLVMINDQLCDTQPTGLDSIYQRCVELHVAHLDGY